MTHDVILAIDSGGTRTRCVAFDRDGRILGRGEGGPSNHLLIDHARARDGLTVAMDGALTDGALSPSAVRCVAAGLAGVDYDGAGADVGRSLIGNVGTAVIAIEGDVVIAHLAALAGRPGVVALAGTGSNVLGIGPDGTRIKVGGWGPLFGDEGSAHEIARQALVAAARAYDGLAPATGLTRAFVDRLGLRDFRETLKAVYGGGMEGPDIAALAPLVETVAEAGDETARGILGRAGTDLARGVAVAMDRLGLRDHARVVSYQGAVLGACVLARAAFVGELNRLVPGVRVERPRFAPIIGAYLLGRNALGWPVVDFQRTAAAEGH
jgi:N-acetylglucosamine kinase-like BadF-type ATPase